MADAEDAQILDVSFESDSLSEEGAASNHGYYTINGIVVQYGSYRYPERRYVDSYTVR